jgi:hypothetical protein
MGKQLSILDVCDICNVAINAGATIDAVGREQLSFHNSTNEVGTALIESEAKAYNQEEKILKWFEANPSRLMAPSEIHVVLFSAATPLTSCRRAITNLTRKGYLIKTHISKISPYGRKEMKWGVVTRHANE